MIDFNENWSVTDRLLWEIANNNNIGEKIFLVHVGEIFTVADEFTMSDNYTNCITNILQQMFNENVPAKTLNIISANIGIDYISREANKYCWVINYSHKRATVRND
jgi:uncharacterized protein YxjI